MMALLRVIVAFVLRGWHQMLSYRFAMWLRYATLAFNLLIFFFIWEIFRDANIASSHLERWDGNWFAYAITGGLAMTVLAGSTGTIVSIIRSGQTMGTLETILASPMSVGNMLVAAWLYNLIRVFLSLCVTLGICVWLLEFDPGKMRLDVMLAAFLVMVLAFTPLGILSAGIALAFKRGDPVALVMGAAFTLFGGVVFPPSVLPEWLQGGAKYVPVFYATNLVRESVLNAAGFAEVATEIRVLFWFGAVLMPISIAVFVWGLNKARRDGSLSHY